MFLTFFEMQAMDRDKGRRLESEIQRRLVRSFEKDGWMTVKIELCSKPGFPDLMLLRDGAVRFVEVKRPGSNPRPLQRYRIEELRRQGFDVRVMDGEKEY